jgi:hypothetical protein
MGKVILLLFIFIKGLSAQEIDSRSIYTSAFIHPYLILGGEDGFCTIQHIDSQISNSISIDKNKDILDIIVGSDSIYLLCSGGSIYRLNKSFSLMTAVLHHTIPISSKTFSYYTSHPLQFPLAAGGSNKIFDRKIHLPMGKVVNDRKCFRRPFRFFFAMDEKYIYGSNGFNTKVYQYKNRKIKQQYKFRGIVHCSIHPELLCGSTSPLMNHGMLILNKKRIKISESGMIWNIVDTGEFILACGNNGTLYKLNHNGVLISSKSFSHLPLYTIQYISAGRYFIAGSGGYREIIRIDF